MLSQSNNFELSVSTSKSILIAAFLLAANSIFAQQLPLFTQYREYNSAVNPAAVNSNYLTFEQQGSFGLSYRVQWSDIAASPRTTVLRGEYLFDNMGAVNLLVGGHLLNDQTGPTSFTGAYGRIAGVISDDPAFGGISIGLTGGMVQYRIDATEIRLRDQDDFLATQDQTQLYPDVGFGIFAYRMLDGYNFNGDFIYGGVSVPQVLGLDLNFQDEAGRDFSLKRLQHIYGQLGFIKYLRDDSFLEPSVWVKYVQNAPVNVDVNLRYQFASGLWIGAGGSTAKTSHLEGGVLLGDVEGFGNMLKIGYGFDYSFSSFGPFASGSHEINVSYNFGQ